ncbi:hypothetical protein BH10CYA1_BH10CYA1_62540 [soil metagenome]
MRLTTSSTNHNAAFGQADISITINSACAQFVDFLRSHPDAGRVDFAKSYLENFCAYVEMELPEMLNEPMREEYTRSGKSFGDWAPIGTVGIVLERFFRYHLLRELVTTSDSRGYSANVVFHCLRWQRERNHMSSEDFARIVQVSDRLVAMGKKSYKAATDLADFLSQNEEQLIITKLIAFGRHDVTKIKGKSIWLQAWEPIDLSPDEREIGPVAVPLSVATVLEPGWMVECMLGRKQNGKWEILESSSIYPSLPFK